MSLLSALKAKLAASKLAEEQLYAQAAEEVASGQIRQGLWAKAIAETGGDEAAAKAQYLKLRVEIMKAEAEVTDYAMRQASRESEKGATTGGNSYEVEMAKRFLYGEGYTVWAESGQFKLRDPADGVVEWKTAKQLIEFAKKRGCRL